MVANNKDVKRDKHGPLLHDLTHTLAPELWALTTAANVI
jgi:hypothetical protein